MSISTLPCFSAGWEGRPWHQNTNAPTWQALQDNYAPFEQLVEALIERADVVRATVNTNYPRIELVQTWTVDAGSVTNIIGTNEVLVASGFAADVNGTYTEAYPDYWVSGDRIIAGPASGWTWLYTWEIYADYADWDPDYGASTGPESESWVDFGGGTPVDGATVYGPASIEVNLVTTNVSTTNAFGPFPYSVEVDGNTYSGTGFPHLTYAAMEWIDQQIDALSEYYVPLYSITNPTSPYAPSGASIWLFKDAWDSDGDWSLVGNAGVGATYTGRYVTALGVTNDWELSRYTRQPEITTHWALGEWAWDGTNWQATGSFESMDMRLPLETTNGPLVEAYSGTNGAAISVDVSLAGQTRVNHWGQTDIVTNVTETVSSGSYAMNLWHQLGENATPTTDGISTGDYVVVSYKGPILLYGERPYRLYASDFDERAAVIDGFRYMPIDHEWSQYSLDSKYYPAFTNVYSGSDAKVSETFTDASTITTNDAVPYPAWSSVVPTDLALVLTNSAPSRHIGNSSPWVNFWLTRSTDVLFPKQSHDYCDEMAFASGTPTQYIGRVRVESVFRSAQLVYRMTVNTNTVQGESFPSSFSLINTPDLSVNTTNNYEAKEYRLSYTGAYTETGAGIDDGNPLQPDGILTNPVPMYTGLQPVECDGDYYWQVVRTNYAVAVGEQTYLSGYIGYTNALSGNLPDNITDIIASNYTAYTDSPPYIPSSGEDRSAGSQWQTIRYVDATANEKYYYPNAKTRRSDFALGSSDGGYSWRPSYTVSSSLDSAVPIPGFIDWGTTNGFRYRAE